MQPVTSFAFGNYQGTAFLFWGTVAFGLFIGFMVYLLLVYPKTRSERFREYPAARRITGLSVALVILLGFSTASYFLHWRNFYAIDVYPRSVQVVYHFPDRRVAIAAADLAAISEQLTMEKFDMRCVVLHLASGERLVSAPFPRDEVADVLRELRDWHGTTKR